MSGYHPQTQSIGFNPNTMTSYYIANIAIYQKSYYNDMIYAIVIIFLFVYKNIIASSFISYNSILSLDANLKSFLNSKIRSLRYINIFLLKPMNNTILFFPKVSCLKIVNINFFDISK